MANLLSDWLIYWLADELADLQLMTNQLTDLLMGLLTVLQTWFADGLMD